MQKEKIYLGQVRKEIPPENFKEPPKDLWISGEKLYLEKHSWNCDWYWGFGYIGNNHLHAHAEIFIKDLIWHSVTGVFEDTWITDKTFWVFKDLLKQAYTLKRAAEIYRHGGFISSKKGITDILQNKQMAETINKDLETILNILWTFLKEEKRMAVRNFFIDASIDGIKTRATGGPRSKDGGFQLKISMRENGGIEIPVRINGWANPADDELILQINVEGHDPITIKTPR